MPIRFIKNTVLLFVFCVLNCQEKKQSFAVNTDDNSAVNPSTELIVGANNTTSYLPLLKDKNVGVVANQTSVIFNTSSAGYSHLVDSLIALNINVKKVFSPEHGFRGTSDAGELVEDGIDKKTGLPLISLHGKTKKPTAEHLNDLDVVIFDIQDVGVRFYTYISTLHYVMEACAENNISLIILDRPNPNGSFVAGPVLEVEHRSFLGMHPVPLVHGMTIGEYAQMINGEGWLTNGINCKINVIPVENYNHNSSYSLPIRPSPNLPNDQSIKLYPSLGLFEGTNINAGRGTEFQFQRFGAPFLDKEVYPFSYTPIPNFGAKYPKHVNEICFGKDLSNIDIQRGFTLKFIMEAYNNSIDKSKFFVTSNFTLHAGTKTLQKQIEEGWTESKILNSWSSDLTKFNEVRKKYLLYP